jgi:hypothetical protein
MVVRFCRTTMRADRFNVASSLAFSLETTHLTPPAALPRFIDHPTKE